MSGLVNGIATLTKKNNFRLELNSKVCIVVDYGEGLARNYKWTTASSQARTYITGDLTKYNVLYISSIRGTQERSELLQLTS